MDDNKSNNNIDKVISQFTEVSTNSKKLEETIKGFSSIIKSFNDTVIYLKEDVNLEELNVASKLALENLEKIKASEQIKVDEMLDSKLSANTKSIIELFNSINSNDEDIKNAIESHFSQLEEKLQDSLNNIKIPAVAQSYSYNDSEIKAEIDKLKGFYRSLYNRNISMEKKINILEDRLSAIEFSISEQNNC